MTGVLDVDCVNVEVAAVIVRGAPESQLRMPPNCHRSTRCVTQPGPLPRSGLPGPKGSSKVPLLRNDCVRWNVSRDLLRERFRGLRYVAAPSSLLSPKVLLHV